MDKISKIKLIPSLVPLTPPPIIRAAAYCRVSTLQEKQFHSLSVQREYYKNYISQHPNWIFVGIYSDQSSGRNNKKMRDFQRMLQDCRDGKINLIFVKSISRMGRNTVQFLKACTEFQSLGVDVYFEVEKLHIYETRAIKMLTIYASLFQNESESKCPKAIQWIEFTP